MIMGTMKKAAKGIGFVLSLALVFTSVAMMPVFETEGGMVSSPIASLGVDAVYADEPTTSDAIGSTLDGVYYKILTEPDPEGKYGPPQEFGTVQVGNNVVAAVPTTSSGIVTIPGTVEIGDMTFTVAAIGNNAFRDCRYIESVTLLESLQSIGDYAFYYCRNIKSVTLPENLQSIGSSAFSGCSNLESVTFPENLQSIGSFSFSSCSELALMTLPENLQSIGSSAFSGCSNLESVTLPENLQSIWSSAFSYSGLKSIEIPDSVTNFGSEVFEYCGSLENVVIGNGVTQLNSTFYGCTSLTEITIPLSVKNIGYRSFYNCSSLEEITIPSSVENIVSGAFYNCGSLETIIFEGVTPPAIVTDNTSVFDGCDKLSIIKVPTGKASSYQSVLMGAGLSATVMEDNSTLKITGSFVVDGITYKALPSSSPTVQVGNGVVAAVPRTHAGIVEIPEMVSIDGVTFMVTAIGNSSFKFCSDITSVSMPSSVTSIGQYAFQNSSNSENMSKLVSVDFSENLQSIGDYAFEYCSRLKSVTLPKNLQSIGDYAFYYCYWLESVTLNENLQSIGNYAFSDSGLKSIEIPDSVTNLGGINGRVFEYCRRLENVVIGDGITQINSRIFSSCTSLAAITFKGVTPPAIGTSVFVGCDKLSTINVPTGKASSYQSVLVGAGLSATVMEDDSTLKITSSFIVNGILYKALPSSSPTVQVGNGVVAAVPTTHAGGIEIPSTVEFNDMTFAVVAIGGYAFNGRDIASVTIPPEVTTIGDYAFSGCSKLESVTLPSEIMTIGDYVFSGCSKLELVTLPENLKSIGIDAFYNSGLKSIKIPDSVTNLGYSYSYPDYVFTNCRSLENVIIGNGVTQLRGTFDGCTSLTEITIPSSIKSIGSRSFYNCGSLEEITIPSSVENIGSYAFYNCGSLETIIFEGVTPPAIYSANTSVFDGCDIMDTVWIPVGTKVAYIAALIPAGTILEYMIVETDQSAPAAPTISSKSAYVVTLAAIENAQYRIGRDGAWQDSPVFEGLTPDTEYTFYQRLKADDTHYYVSPSSPGLDVRTDVRPNKAPTLDTAAAATGTVNATATPASIDGSVAVRPYSVDVSGWFSDADGDPLSYEIVTHDAIGVVDIEASSGILTFTPSAADAETSRSISLRVLDDREAVSETLSISVQIGSVPANILKLEVRKDGSGSFVYDGLTHYGSVSAYIGGQSDPTDATIRYKHNDSGFSWIPTPPGIVNVGVVAYDAFAYKDGFVTSDAISLNLEVTARPLTITVHDAEKVFDGTPLIASEYTISGLGLATGQTVGAVTFSGIQTEAGQSNAGAEIRIDAQGEDVTSNYDITVVPGKLTVLTPTPSSPKPGQDIVQGRDHFAFINTTSHFFKGIGSRTYKVTGDYYEQLLAASQIESWPLSSMWRQYLIDTMNSSWGGSCFGMSAVVSLTKAGRLTPGFFQPGAGKLYNFSYPRDSQTVTNLINYYQLMQATPITNRTIGGSSSASVNRRAIVEAVKSSAYPVIIGFNIFTDPSKYFLLGGHAVVGYDVKEVGNNYEIKIWDPNYSTAQSNTLIISKDYSSDSFRSGTDYRYITLRTAQKTVDGNYDYKNIQDYLSGKGTSGFSAFGGSDSIQAMAAGESGATLMTNYADFTITSSDGKSAVVENGKKKPGDDLDIGDGVARNEIDAELWIHFDVPAPGVGITYTVSPTGTVESTYKTALFCKMENGYYANIESGAMGDFVFGADGAVNARLSVASQATIALTTDSVGDMYTTSVTGDGDGGGIGLSPAAGGGVEASFSGNAQIKTSGDYNFVEFEDVSTDSGNVTITETVNEVILEDGSTKIATATKGHSIAFHTLGGTPIEALVNIPDGTAEKAPKTPELEGYTFAGWYQDENYSKAFSFASAVTSNLTLYAKWDKKTTDGGGSNGGGSDGGNGGNGGGSGNGGSGSGGSGGGSGGWAGGGGGGGGAGAAPGIASAKKAAKATAKPTTPKKLAAPKVTAGKKQIKITWKKSATKGVSGYEVQYRVVGQKWVTKKAGVNATSLTIKKLKPGKSYEVRVRAYTKSGGKTAYGAWSKAVKSGKVKR
jgi:uncharacterized repeat protein (TIGR02543 family)